MKYFLLILIPFLLFAVTVKPVVSKQFHKVVKVDSVQIVLPDSVLIVSTTTVGIVDTYKDTVKLIRSDSTIATKRDTVRAKRK